MLTGLVTLLSYSTQDHYPRSGTTYSELGPLTSIIKPFGGDIFSTEIPVSSHITLVCVRLT